MVSNRARVQALLSAMLALLAIPALAQDPTPPARPAATAKVAGNGWATSWMAFLEGYRPALTRGLAGAMLPYDLVKTYMDSTVTWTGTFSGFRGVDSALSVVIGMLPVDIALPPPRKTARFDFIVSRVEQDQLAEWKSLRSGDRIEFQAVLGGLISFFPATMVPDSMRLGRVPGEELPIVLIQKARLVRRLP